MKLTPDQIISLVSIGLDTLAVMQAKGEVTPEKLADVKSKYDAIGGDWDKAVAKAKEHIG